MPLGIVSDSDFENELQKSNSNSKNLNDNGSGNGKVEQLPARGRGPGNIEVPQSIKQLIGVSSIEDGRAESLQLAERFSISSSSVSAYTNGANSTATYDKPNPELKKVNDGIREKITSKARSRLLKAINHITDDNLKGSKPRDLAAIAKDMSAVVKNLEPDTNSNSTNLNNPTFVVYAPQIRREEVYETIQLQE